MLEVSNVKLPLDAGCMEGDYSEDAKHRALHLVRTAAARALGVAPEEVQRVRILKRSVDARKKKNVHFVATLGVELANDQAEDQALSVANVKRHQRYEPLDIPNLGLKQVPGGESANVRPVVIGAGPAGLFCALYLARAGLRPVVLERGGDVEERAAAVAAFNTGGPLDVHTNIQFGEGGAGTFSDGKLTTNIKNPMTPHVLHWFVQAGAPQEILWQAKPHIGTDKLIEVVRTLRAQIEQEGGSVRFHAQVTDFQFEGGSLVGLEVLDTRTKEVEHLVTRQAVLACGHSARDTFQALQGARVAMQRKPFSVGVRIEHNQQAINQAQYGSAATHPALGAADYKLAVHLPSGRSVYTFCMCPGGEVVCAASENEGVVVNGMSRFARDGQNANSALLVGVNPEDFEGDDVLAGVDFQRRMEQAAYRVAQQADGVPFAAPAQRVGDFMAGQPSAAQSAQTGVQPTYARGVVWCNLRECLPSFVAESLTEALPLLDRKLHGFAAADAVMTGVETRSSSPVRIVRNEAGQAVLDNEDSEASAVRGNAPVQNTSPTQNTLPTQSNSPTQNTSPGPHSSTTSDVSSGLFPCGEGAGYAGGIMSAACDGLRIAQAVCATHQANNR